MFIAKVVGKVWATQKHKSLKSTKLLLVRQIDFEDKNYKSEVMLAVDQYIDAGIDDLVLVMDEGNSARQILKNKYAPIRTVVCGVIDEVYQYGNKY